MKVQLKILRKGRGKMRVSVYEVTSDARIYLCVMEGTIPEIVYKLNQKYGERIEVEKSIFQGWY
jgi:hypothetical protein